MNLEMPLEQLYQYKGSSPKPDDFDQYWARALTELDEQSLDYELVPAEFQTPIAECYHLYFTGVGGAKVHAKYVKPTPMTGKGATSNTGACSSAGAGVVQFHGYSVDSGDWSDKVTLAAHGITVLALDCRGQGGLSQDTVSVQGMTLRGHVVRGLGDSDPDHLYYRNVFLDTVQCVRILMSMAHVDENRIGVQGVSQGGALAVACAGLEPRVKLAVCVYPFLCDYKKAWQSNLTSSAYEELAYFFRIYDPNHKREDEIFNKLGYIDIQNLAERIRGKVLWLMGLSDPICPPSTQFAAYNKITAEKELLLYHEFGHEYLPGQGDHMLQFLLKL